MDIAQQSTFPYLLTYWGTKGGGERFALETLEELALLLPEYRILTSLRTSVFENLSSRTKAHVINYDPSISLVDYIPWNIRRRTIFHRKNWLTDNNLVGVINLMIHPTDLKWTNVWPIEFQKVQVIHDLKRHPGDFWPTRRLIKKSLRAGKIIALSEFIFNQIEHEHKFLARFERTNLPPILAPFETIPSKYFLIAGRLRKYKNLDWLHQINLDNLEFPILIAGLCNFDIPKHKNIIQINRWLTTPELEYLISKSKAVICTHSEASQSGLVQQAVSWKVPSVVSDMGALPAQIEFGKKGIVVTSSNLVDELASALENINQKTFDFSNNEDQKLPSAAELVIKLFTQTS